MTTPPKRHRAKFGPDEDQRLCQLVAKYGEQWIKVAQEMPNRSVRQCRERWKHYLCCPGRKLPWNSTEDMILFQQAQIIGLKWSKLATFLPGRTDIEIKNRWMQKFQQKVIFPQYSSVKWQPRMAKPPADQQEVAPVVEPAEEVEAFSPTELVDDKSEDLSSIWSGDTDVCW